MQHSHFDELFLSFQNLKIGVIGDIMLDTYWWGKVDRISPEAPVPVVSVTKKEMRIGGAGNVALNIKALGVEVHAISIIGNDDEGKQLTTLMNQHQINTDYLIGSDARQTTNKIRIISRNQHMMRLDAEITDSILPKEEEALLHAFKTYLEQVKPQLVILEDYNKGVLTSTAIPSLIALCKQYQVLIAVDPKRKNFFEYQGVDIFKPNLQEAKEALNLILDDVQLETMKDIHQQLHKVLHHQVSFITLSEKGVFYQNGEGCRLIPTHIRSIADVSGAGDTVISVAAVVYAATKNVVLMAEMANIAGGLVCEEVGTVAINKEKLLQECKRLLV